MSDPTIPDNQRTGLDLLTRIEELTEGVHGDGHSWRHLLLACAAEMQRLTRRGDHYCEQFHEANRQLAECVNRLKALEATLPKTVDGVTIHHGMREAWLAGYIEGLRAYAWWKDGTQYVGSCGTTLAEAIDKAREEATAYDLPLVHFQCGEDSE